MWNSIEPPHDSSHILRLFTFEFAEPWRNGGAYNRILRRNSQNWLRGIFNLFFGFVVDVRSVSATWNVITCEITLRSLWVTMYHVLGFVFKTNHFHFFNKQLVFSSTKGKFTFRSVKVRFIIIFQYNILRRNVSSIILTWYRAQHMFDYSWKSFMNLQKVPQIERRLFEEMFRVNAINFVFFSWLISKQSGKRFWGQTKSQRLIATFMAFSPLILKMILRLIKE